MNFKNFLGNEKVKEQISYLINSSRLPHAIIIEGDEGTGKRTLAREIACALVCRGSGEKPCGSCAQCVKAQKGVHPDIFEHSASGGARSFHVDVIRDVINDVYMSPNESDYKIYILGNAHCMSESAQNALLKILEEPPSYAVFILTAVNKSALLETVLSRAVTLSISGVDAKTGADYITEINPDADYKSAYSAVNAFGGNIGKALESLEGGRLAQITSLANSIALGITADNEYELLKTVSAFGKSRQDMLSALNLLQIMLRDALTGREVLSGQNETVGILKNKLTKIKLINLYNTTQNLIDAADKNANAALLTTKICYSLREAAGR